MLAYEIHVSGPQPDEDANRVRDALASAADAPIDPPYPLSDRVRSLLLPPGVEWSFGRLREVVAVARDSSSGSAVSLVGVPDDDRELYTMLMRQARMLATHGHEARARALHREARTYAELIGEIDAWAGFRLP
ncbi:MAG: hypothetical protein H6738_08950 [Alphaproteobacteria bacterium]|nr:hypothetical protein [Alphaproteobacteria bacterium]MCB9696889.1 hypothetical protein [Alphaproteobacteria bacterium]